MMDWFQTFRTLLDVPHLTAFGVVWLAWRQRALENRVQELTAQILGCPVCRKRSIVPSVLTGAIIGAVIWS